MVRKSRLGEIPAESWNALNLPTAGGALSTNARTITWLSLCASPSCGTLLEFPGGRMTSADQNKALVRRFYAEIDKGNIAILDELVAENYMDHNPPPFPTSKTGRERLKEDFKIFLDATPGHH